MNIITRASVKERIHVEQIIRSQPHMHNSGLVDIVTIPVRKCLGLSMDVYKPVGEVKEPLPIILDVHGGGLIAGRKEQNRNQHYLTVNKDDMVATYPYPFSCDDGANTLLKATDTNILTPVERLFLWTEYKNPNPIDTKKK